MGRRIAENLRARRRSLGLSLDELARISGVSRAAISQIETRKTNPSLGVLWKVAVGIGLRFSDLIGEGAGASTPSGGADHEALRSSDGTFESRPLARAGTGPGVEVYELHLTGQARHASEPHGPGTSELIVVLAGSLRMTVGAQQHRLSVGESLAFPADQPHAYENPGTSPAVYCNVIIYPC